jgi:hypothetical protein
MMGVSDAPSARFVSDAEAAEIPYTGGAGEGRLVHREGSAVVTGGWITQADRACWQQRAAAELAAILSAHPDMPVIA